MAKGVVQLRIGEGMKAVWQQAADDAGENLSEFVRSAVDQRIGLVRVTSPEPVRQSSSGRMAVLETSTGRKACKAHPGSKMCEHRALKGSFCRFSGSIVE